MHDGSFDELHHGLAAVFKLGMAPQAEGPCQQDRVSRHRRAAGCRRCTLTHTGGVTAPQPPLQPHIGHGKLEWQAMRPQSRKAGLLAACTACFLHQGAALALRSCSQTNTVFQPSGIGGGGEQKHPWLCSTWRCSQHPKRASLCTAPSCFNGEDPQTGGTGVPTEHWEPASSDLKDHHLRGGSRCKGQSQQGHCTTPPPSGCLPSPIKKGKDKKSQLLAHIYLNPQGPAVPYLPFPQPPAPISHLHGVSRALSSAAFQAAARSHCSRQSAGLNPPTLLQGCQKCSWSKGKGTALAPRAHSIPEPPAALTSVVLHPGVVGDALRSEAEAQDVTGVRTVPHQEGSIRFPLQLHLCILPIHRSPIPPALQERDTPHQQAAGEEGLKARPHLLSLIHFYTNISFPGCAHPKHGLVASGWENTTASTNHRWGKNV